MPDICILCQLWATALLLSGKYMSICKHFNLLSHSVILSLTAASNFPHKLTSESNELHWFFVLKRCGFTLKLKNASLISDKKLTIDKTKSSHYNEITKVSAASTPMRWKLFKCHVFQGFVITLHKKQAIDHRRHLGELPGATPDITDWGYFVGKSLQPYHFSLNLDKV